MLPAVVETCSGPSTCRRKIPPPLASEHRRAGNASMWTAPPPVCARIVPEASPKSIWPPAVSAVTLEPRSLHADIAASRFKRCNSLDAPRLNLSATGAKNSVTSDVSRRYASTRCRRPQTSCDIADRDMAALRLELCRFASGGGRGSADVFRVRHGPTLPTVIFPPAVARATRPSISCTSMFPPCVLILRS